MRFATPLVEGELIRRYKRFLADVRLPDGEVITAHTPNTGSMLGCAEPGSRVWIRDSGNPKRKYPWSWEISETAGGVKVGINTLLSNHLVREGIETGAIPELGGYDTIRSEVSYGSGRSRIDLLLEKEDRPNCYVEVKNVTAAEGAVAFFPDAPTLRGIKHLHELMEMVKQGNRAVLFFCVQRADVRAVRPADHIDPEYGRMLREAVASGVEIIAYQTSISIREIRLIAPLETKVSGFCRLASTADTGSNFPGLP